MMLQQERAEDFVLATGETHPVREFVIKAFREVGIDLECVLFILESGKLTVGTCLSLKMVRIGCE